MMSEGKVCTCAIRILAWSLWSDERAGDAVSGKRKNVCYDRQPENRDMLLRQVLMVSA